MGFFDDIKAKIFGAPVAASVSGQAVTPTPGATSSPTASPEVAVQQQAAVDAGMAAANKVIADAIAQKEAAAAAQSQVDVAAVLDEAVAKSGQKLNWKTSIVDLMKALDMDSSHRPQGTG